MKILITLEDEELSLFKMIKKIMNCTEGGHSMPIILDAGECEQEQIFLDGDGDFMIKKIELVEE